MTEKEYIDKDLILSALENAGGCDGSTEWDKGYDAGIEAAIELVENIHAADVAPVRHGHWKNISESDMSKTVMCSVCNKMFYFTKKGQLNIDMVPYCPNCGVKMDEVEQ